MTFSDIFRFFSLTLRLAVFVLLCCSAVSCRHDSVNCEKECSYDEELIFQTGFNNAVFSNISPQWLDIHGIDTQFIYANDWDMLDEHESIGDFKINFEDGDASQRGAAFVPDPENADNTVLNFYIRAPHIRELNHKKSRVQADINRNLCLREFYQTVRLYLHPDMNYLTRWEKNFSWLSLFEFWNNANWTGEKYPFRVTVNIRKETTGPVDALFLNVKGDIYNYAGRWEAAWEQTALDFPLPIGAWMNIELYIREGDSNNGRFYLAIQAEGKEKQVVFNITNTTLHPQETCPDGFTDIHPLKFYTSEELTDYMKNGGKKLELFWDDWKIYRNKAPEEVF